MLLRQTLLFLPAQIVGPVFQLVSTFVWTHFLLPDQLGLFALVSAAQELAFATTLLWFSLYTVRYFDARAGEAENARYHGTEVAVVLAAVAAMVAGLAIIPLGANVRLQGSLLVAACAFVVSRSVAAYQAERARSEGDALSYTVLNTAGPVLGLLFALLLVSLLPPSAELVLAGYTAAQTGSVVYAAQRMHFHGSPRFASLSVVKSAIRYGLPLFFGGLLIFVANNGVRYLVEWKEGLAGVGLVTVGWALGTRAAQFATLLTAAAAFPLAIARARDEGIAAGERQMIANGVLMAATLAPATAGLYAIAVPLVHLIIAPQYQAVTAAVLPAAILTGAMRNFRVHFANQIFLLHERTAIPVINDGLDALATLVLGGLGLWWGGLVGCVVGVAAGACLTLVTGFYAAYHYHRFMFPLVDAAKIAAATLAMMIAVRAYGPSATLVSLTVSVVLGAAVYGIVLAAGYPQAAMKAARILNDRWTALRLTPPRSAGNPD